MIESEEKDTSVVTKPKRSTLGHRVAGLITFPCTVELDARLFLLFVKKIWAMISAVSACLTCPNRQYVNSAA